jgi:hypothetical protein
MNNKSLFDETVPVFINFLKNLEGVLDTANRYASKNKKLSEKKLVNGRLAPDMYTLAQQVGYAYFMAFEVVENLAGKKAPEFTYDEKTIKELKTSLKRAVTFLKTVKPKDFKPRKSGIQTFLHAKKKFSDEAYIHNLALPNFFFHVTTAYDIARHLGVPLTKQDYLGL